MKKFAWIYVLFVAVMASCKTQQFTMPLVIRDSISVTYRQGVVISPADYADSAAMATSRASLLNASSVGEATSNEAHKMSLPRKDRVVLPRSPLITQIPIRVDTVYIERWHSQIGREVGDRARDRPKPFYRHCTWGFFILILLFLGRTAFKLIKLIYLRR